MAKDPKNIEIGLRIKHVRTNELSLPQWKLAEELEFGNQSTIASYEVGAMEVGAKFLINMYNKYGIMTAYILHGTLPMKKGKKSNLDVNEEIALLKEQINILTFRLDNIERGRSDK